MGEDKDGSHSTEAIVQKIVHVLHRTLQDVEQEYVYFARQRNYFINAIKHRINPAGSNEERHQFRVKLGVKTLGEVRKLLSVAWSSDSENGSSANTQGALEMFLDLTYQLSELRENLDENLPDHARQHCQADLDEWKRLLSDNYDLTYLDKEESTLDFEDRPGYSGLVSLLPCVLDTANTVFQILGELYGARKDTPYRPQLKSKSKDPNVLEEEMDDDVFVTAQSVLTKDDQKNKIGNEKERKLKTYSSILSPRQGRTLLSRENRKAPPKVTRRVTRQVTHLSPRIVTKQPTYISRVKAPLTGLQTRKSGKHPVQVTSQQRERQSKYISMQDFVISPTKQVISSPRATTPYQRVKKEDFTRFPTVEKQKSLKGIEDYTNVQKSAFKSQLPYLRKLHGIDNASPRHAKLSSPPIVSQSFPRQRGGKMTHFPLHSSLDPARQDAYPRMQRGQHRISTSSLDSLDAVPVSVIYHGSTIYNYPGGEVTSDMDHTTRAIKRIEERLLPQMDSLKAKMRKGNLKQREDSNIINTLENRLRKMEDEIEDIKTRQLLHNYYLRDVLKTATIKDLDIIKDHVAYKDIIELGVKLGLSEVDVEDVKEETNKPREQVLQMLLSWRNKLGKSATLDLIIEALISIKRRETANSIIMDMKNRS